VTDEHRLYQVDEHVFRVVADRPAAPAEVYADGEWRMVVLSTEDVLTLMNARELTPKEIEELGLTT
jgi:hypothetical protein